MRLWTVMTVLAGCASSKADMALSRNGESASANDAGEMTEDDGGLPQAAQPVAWELNGEIVLDADVIEEDDSMLSVRMLSSDRSVLCEADVSVETATTMDPSRYPEETLVGWWRVFVDEPKAGGCFGEDYDFPVPVPMLLGIGPMHPEIVAAVGANADVDNIDGLNGAYASMDGGDTLWVFGVIGTDDAFLGQSGPEESAPLSDGVWNLEAVYSFPL